MRYTFENIYVLADSSTFRTPVILAVAKKNKCISTICLLLISLIKLIIEINNY